MNAPSTSDKSKPGTMDDYKMSARHLKDSIEYNKRHLEEHTKAMKESYKLLKEREKVIHKGRSKALKKYK